MDTPDVWAAITAMLGAEPENFLVRHQLDSYDDFVTHKIGAIIEGFNDLDLHFNWMPQHNDYEVKMHITVSNPQLTRPVAVERDGTTRNMTPTLARERGFTYGAGLTVDVRVRAHTLSNQEGADFAYALDEKVLHGVSLGLIPVMVRSSLCVWGAPSVYGCSDECGANPGGYFIVNGTERVVVSQDRMPENRPFVYSTSKTVAYSHAAEVRSLVSYDFGVPKITTLRISSKPNQMGRFVHVTMHHVNANIPLFVLFRALGVESDSDILDMIAAGSPDGHFVYKELGGCALECGQLGVYTREAAMDWLLENTTLTGVPREYCVCQTFRLSALRRMLSTELLPHVGEDLASKAIYLADLARLLLLTAIGMRPTDDRDSYICKRVNAPGALLANLMRQYYGKLVKEVRRAVLKDLQAGGWRSSGFVLNCVTYSNISKIFKTTTIENGLRHALATGNWGIKTGATQGVSQVLSRYSYLATLSHLRRVSTSIDKNSKLVQPRKLNGTQFGVFCPAETPEGASVGVVKNLALGASVTVASDPTMARRVIGTLVDFDPQARVPVRGCIVKLNYKVVGSTTDAVGLVDELRARKRCGYFHPHTAVVWDIAGREVCVNTDGGRLVRPLLVLDDLGRTLLTATDRTWESLMIKGAVEYLDVEEGSHTLVAIDRDSVTPGHHRYMELHACLTLGVLASCIPFPDHNQSPRNSYQSAMGKQAIGMYSRRFLRRMDTGVHVMDYGQRPLVSTRMSDIMGCSEMVSGSNVVIAISTLAGYNQEDAVILNASSVQRGLFACTYYTILKETLQKNPITGEEEQFYKPTDEQVVNKSQCYDKITETGFPKLGTLVGANDVVISKYMPNRGEEGRDASYALRTNEHGTVDRIIAAGAGHSTVNGDGYSFCKVRLREHREPRIGDKLSSRSGQKGTIGMLVPAHDMPFTADGVVPDIVINPHAYPSRMTIAQLLEGLLGKACCMDGGRGDATPFDGTRYEDVCEQLADCGFDMSGDEVMYDPRSGRQLDVAVSLTMVTYQRLKHIVADKVHGRGRTGPVVSLSRQPAEGRARDGGLRIGEMEVELLWAHGTSGFLKERFSECSDGFRVHLCCACNAIAEVNEERQQYRCPACPNNVDFRQVVVPYAFKLLTQEVGAMGVGIGFKPVHAAAKWMGYAEKSAQILSTMNATSLR